MSTLVTILHVFVCVFLMITVLLQAGKGGGMGAAFGGGTSQGSVFGGSGAGNFLRKLTVAAATTFMLTSMTLAWLSSSGAKDGLIRYSAQQRRADQLRNTALDDARGSTPPEGGEAPEGTENMVLPDGDPSMDMPEGDVPMGLPGEGDEPAPVDTPPPSEAPSPGPAPAAAPTEPTPTAPPVETKPAPAPAPKPETKPAPAPKPETKPAPASLPTPSTDGP